MQKTGRVLLTLSVLVLFLVPMTSMASTLDPMGSLADYILGCAPITAIDTTFSPAKHVYNMTTLCVVQSGDGPKPVTFATASSYVKDSTQLYTEKIIGDDGTSIVYEGTCPVDPMLFGAGGCNKTKLDVITPLQINLDYLCPIIARHITPATRSSLQAQYHTADQLTAKLPPVVLKPKSQSIQTSTSKILLEMKLPYPAVTPCEHWSFTAEFDRMVSGKWGYGAPNSGTVTKARPQEGANGMTYCYGTRFFDFVPNQYRVSVRARHQDGRTTGRSPWSEFKVALKEIDSNKMPAAIGFTAPEEQETFFPGDRLEIRWVSLNIQGNVALSLINNVVSGQTQTESPITSPNGTENDGNFHWTIPQGLAPGKYMIKINSVDGQHQATLPILVFMKINQGPLSPINAILQVDGISQKVTLVLPGTEVKVQFQHKEGNIWRMAALPRLLNSREIKHAQNQLTQREYRFDVTGTYRYRFKDAKEWSQWETFEIKSKGDKKTGRTAAMSPKTSKVLLPTVKEKESSTQAVQPAIMKSPRFTSFASGKKFTVNDRISLKADHDRSIAVIFVLQQKNRDGYKTLKKTGKSSFSNLGPGLYRVGVVYQGEVKMPNTWVEFSIKKDKKPQRLPSGPQKNGSRQSP